MLRVVYEHVKQVWLAALVPRGWQAQKPLHSSLQNLGKTKLPYIQLSYSKSTDSDGDNNKDKLGSEKATREKCQRIIDYTFGEGPYPVSDISGIPDVIKDHVVKAVTHEQVERNESKMEKDTNKNVENSTQKHISETRIATPVLPTHQEELHVENAGVVAKQNQQVSPIKYNSERKGIINNKHEDNLKCQKIYRFLENSKDEQLLCDPEKEVTAKEAPLKPEPTDVTEKAKNEQQTHDLEKTEENSKENQLKLGLVELASGTDSTRNDGSYDTEKTEVTGKKARPDQEHFHPFHGTETIQMKLDLDNLCTKQVTAKDSESKPPNLGLINSNKKTKYVKHSKKLRSFQPEGLNITLALTNESKKTQATKNIKANTNTLLLLTQCKPKAHKTKMIKQSRKTTPFTLSNSEYKTESIEQSMKTTPYKLKAHETEIIQGRRKTTPFKVINSKAHEAEIIKGNRKATPFTVINSKAYEAEIIKGSRKTTPFTVINSKAYEAEIIKGSRKTTPFTAINSKPYDAEIIKGSRKTTPFTVINSKAYEAEIIKGSRKTTPFTVINSKAHEAEIIKGSRKTTPFTVINSKPHEAEIIEGSRKTTLFTVINSKPHEAEIIEGSKKTTPFTVINSKSHEAKIIEGSRKTTPFTVIKSKAKETESVKQIRNTTAFTLTNSTANRTESMKEKQYSPDEICLDKRLCINYRLTKTTAPEIDDSQRSKSDDKLLEYIERFRVSPQSVSNGSNFLEPPIKSSNDQSLLSAEKKLKEATKMFRQEIMNRYILKTSSARLIQAQKLLVEATHEFCNKLKKDCPPSETVRLSNTADRPLDKKQGRNQSVSKTKFKVVTALPGTVQLKTKYDATKNVIPTPMIRPKEDSTNPITARKFSNTLNEPTIRSIISNKPHFERHVGMKKHKPVIAFRNAEKRKEKLFVDVAVAKTLSSVKRKIPETKEIDHTTTTVLLQKLNLEKEITNAAALKAKLIKTEDVSPAKDGSELSRELCKATIQVKQAKIRRMSKELKKTIDSSVKNILCTTRPTSDRKQVDISSAVFLLENMKRDKASLKGTVPCHIDEKMNELKTYKTKSLEISTGLSTNELLAKELSKPPKNQEKEEMVNESEETRNIQGNQNTTYYNNWDQNAQQQYYSQWNNTPVVNPPWLQGMSAYEYWSQQYWRQQQQQQQQYSDNSDDKKTGPPGKFTPDYLQSVVPTLKTDTNKPKEPTKLSQNESAQPILSTKLYGETQNEPVSKIPELKKPDKAQTIITATQNLRNFTINTQAETRNKRPTTCQFEKEMHKNNLDSKIRLPLSPSIRIQTPDTVHSLKENNEIDVDDIPLSVLLNIVRKRNKEKKIKEAAMVVFGTKRPGVKPPKYNKGGPPSDYHSGPPDPPSCTSKPIRHAQSLPSFKQKHDSMPKPDCTSTNKYECVVVEDIFNRAREILSGRSLPTLQNPSFNRHTSETLTSLELKKLGKQGSNEDTGLFMDFKPRSRLPARSNQDVPYKSIKILYPIGISSHPQLKRKGSCSTEVHPSVKCLWSYFLSCYYNRVFESETLKLDSTKRNSI